MVPDRILELRRVRASTLRPHPRNWRIHPAAQRAALAAVLDEIGYADALLARELPDGSLELIDGHLRAETTPDQEVPVLVVDVTAEEAEKLLATIDPLVMMAEANREVLAELSASLSTSSEDLRGFLDKLVDDHASRIQSLHRAQNNENPSPPLEVTIPESYQVLVECPDEQAQKSIYERLTAEGYRCRVLTM
jgi:hypothetical protein